MNASMDGHAMRGDAQYAICFADASEQQRVCVHRATEHTDVKVVVSSCVLRIELTQSVSAS